MYAGWPPRFGFAALSVFIILVYFPPPEDKEDVSEGYLLTSRHKLVRWTFCILSGCLDSLGKIKKRLEENAPWLTDQGECVLDSAVPFYLWLPKYAVILILVVIYPFFCFAVALLFLVLISGMEVIFKFLLAVFGFFHLVPEICLFLLYYCWRGYPDNYVIGLFNRVWISRFELVMRLVVYSIPIIGLGFYLPVLAGGPGVLLVSIPVLVFLICLDERAYMQWLRGKTEPEQVLPYHRGELVLQSEGEQQEEEEDREQIDALHMATTK